MALRVYLSVPCFKCCKSAMPYLASLVEATFSSVDQSLESRLMMSSYRKTLGRTETATIQHVLCMLSVVYILSFLCCHPF